MKDWLKSNWLSVFAIILSVVALCRCEPFVFTESSLNWLLGIIVGIVGIAVSAALVIQIWTAMQIEKLMDKKIKETKIEADMKLKTLAADMKKVASELDNKSFNQMTSTSMYVMGQVKALTQEYNDALYSFLLAIKSAKAAGHYNLCDLYADHTLSFFDEIGGKAHLWMSSEDKDIQIKDISGIPEGKRVAVLIRFIASLPENP